MIMAQEELFIKAREEFDALLSWIDEADGEGLRIDQVERGLFSRLLAIGFILLEAFVVKFGHGDVGETVEREGRTLRRCDEPHRRRYLSIFGELMIERFVYAVRPKQKIEYVPVDEQLGLPIGESSYVLEDWLEKLCVKDSFDEGVQMLHDWLGVKLSVRSAEAINRRMAEHAESYRQSHHIPLRKKKAKLSSWRETARACRCGDPLKNASGTRSVAARAKRRTRNRWLMSGRFTQSTAFAVRRTTLSTKSVEKSAIKTAPNRGTSEFG